MFITVKYIKSKVICKQKKGPTVFFPDAALVCNKSACVKLPAGLSISIINESVTNRTGNKQLFLSNSC